MMLAHIKMAPAANETSDAVGARLQAIADTLTILDALWIAEQAERGCDAPCCSHCAAPPWVPRAGVEYIEHHGPELGEGRLYLDAGSMFAAGRGTCIDVCAYDAAARLMRGEDARAIVLPTARPGAYHCVVQANGTIHDVTAAWFSSSCGCGCKGEG